MYLQGPSPVIQWEDSTLEFSYNLRSSRTDLSSSESKDGTEGVIDQQIRKSGPVK